MQSSKQIADYIVAFFHEHGDPVSNLKLQKLLYYAQAWSLALYDTPLFEERIEAWVHGPVVPVAYGLYKGWAWQPICENIDLLSLETPDKVVSHLNEIIDNYGGMSAYELEKLTHSEMPWQNARKGIPLDQPSNEVILHDDMRSFYRQVVNGKNP